VSQQETYSRPTTIEEVNERMKNFATPEGCNGGSTISPIPRMCLSSRHRSVERHGCNRSFMD